MVTKNVSAVIAEVTRSRFVSDNTVLMKMFHLEQKTPSYTVHPQDITLGITSLFRHQ